MQQSHSNEPQSQGIQGLVGPLTPFLMDEVEDVEGGMVVVDDVAGGISGS